MKTIPSVDLLPAAFLLLAILLVAAVGGYLLTRRRPTSASTAEPPPPRTLEPPKTGDAHAWRSEWVRSVRETPGAFVDDAGRETPIARHLFLGTALTKEFFWRERATPSAYWSEGGVREWAHQKYRDWTVVGPSPLYLHEDLFKQHVYINGMTGAGKSSLGITSLLLQLMDGHVVDGVTGRSAKRPVVILDMKGDPALFHTVRHAASERGQTFKFFNLEHNAPTYRFNPFRGFNPKSRSVMQFCQLVLDALALNHGRFYGAGYFTERSRAALTAALDENPDVMSFKELAETLRRVLRNERDKRAVSDAFELLSVCETLARYPQLVTSPEDETTNRDGIIFMPDVIAERQVVYFWLPAALESISAGEIAKLVLFNLRAAAEDHHRKQQSKEQLEIVLVIDELQRVLGENLAGILQDARSFGIGAILANQSLDDLKMRDGFSLASTVLENTMVKLMFTHPDDTTFYAFVQRNKGLTKARQYPARTDPRLRELGLEEFAYEVRSTWPLSFEQYQEWNTTVLPGWDEIPGGDWRATAAPTAPPPAGPPEDDVRAAHVAFINSLFDRVGALSDHGVVPDGTSGGN